MFSRFASFIEVGGRTGLGYRDTAQDAMTIPHSNPEKCRQRIVELLKGLVSAGYGLHLFQPEWFEKDKKEKPFKSPTVIPDFDKKNMVHGIEDACSDDALWLIAAITEYVKETGDVTFVDRIVTYADGGEGSVYEHMTKILDFSASQVGQQGVCKGLRADWNDCLNLGGGESAMVSFLHYWAIENFLQLAEYLGKKEDVKKYTAMAEKVKKVCDEQLWDEEWFIRGITKNGKKIGTKEDKEGRVHLESNAWAVLSGAVDEEKGRKAMEYYDALCPYYQNDKIEVRESEPYSYCQFVMGRDHTGFGRARHPFMTGTGGWAYFSATRYILGIRPQLDYLEIDPCIPAYWEGFSADRVWRGALIHIQVENPNHKMKGVKEIWLDGQKVEKIPVMEEGSEHQVRVVIGK